MPVPSILIELAIWPGELRRHSVEITWTGVELSGNPDVSTGLARDPAPLPRRFPLVLTGKDPVNT